LTGFFIILLVLGARRSPLEISIEATPLGKNSDGLAVLARGAFNRSPAKMDCSTLLRLLDQFPEPL